MNSHFLRGPSPLSVSEIEKKHKFVVRIEVRTVCFGWGINLSRSNRASPSKYNIVKAFNGDAWLPTNQELSSKVRRFTSLCETSSPVFPADKSPLMAVKCHWSTERQKSKPFTALYDPRSNKPDTTFGVLYIENTSCVKLQTWKFRKPEEADDNSPIIMVSRRHNTTTNCTNKPGPGQKWLFVPERRQSGIILLPITIITIPRGAAINKVIIFMWPKPQRPTCPPGLDYRVWRWGHLRIWWGINL